MMVWKASIICAIAILMSATRKSFSIYPSNNESAYYCYKAIGFEDVPPNEIEKYNVMGEEWDCLELDPEVFFNLSFSMDQNDNVLDICYEAILMKWYK